MYLWAVCVCVCAPVRARHGIRLLWLALAGLCGGDSVNPMSTPAHVCSPYWDIFFGGVDINHCSSKAQRKKAQGLLSYPVMAWPTWQKEKSAAMSYTNIQMCKKSNSGVQRLGLNATVGGGNGVCFGVKCPSAALSAARSCICNLMFLWRKLPTCKVARKQRWQKKKRNWGSCGDVMLVCIYYLIWAHSCLCVWRLGNQIWTDGHF